MNLLIVDDHTLLLDSLALLLQQHYGDELHLVLAENGQAALEQLDQNPAFDLILLDIDLPDIHGFQMLQQLGLNMPDTPVVALSGIITPPFIRQCLALGAAGFIPKTSTGKEMCAAIELVLSGGTYIPEEALPNMLHETARPVLTNRQMDVLRLIRQGMSNDEIASVLGISITTVKTHVHGILAALGVKSRTEAVNEALLAHLL